MKHLLLLQIAFLPLIAAAQVKDPEFEKIAKKYEKGSFESALESAETVMDNSHHKKNPEPYLWASMSYYGIHRSEDEKLQERFRSALRDALKYAGKAASKDTDGSFVKANQEYFTTMVKEGIELTQQYEAAGDLRKASYTLKQLQAIVPADANIQFAKGVMDLRLNSMNEAQKEIQASFPILGASYRDLAYQPDPVSSIVVRSSVLEYAEHLISTNLMDSARTVLLSARVFFPLDDEIKLKLQNL